MITCRELPFFRHDALEAVRAAFRGAMSIPLRQHWLPQTQTEFRSGTVCTGWRDNDLFVFAELDDADIFTAATGPNQRMWELGDTFEIFLRAEPQVPYIELHVTPPNHRLQLRFASAQAFRSKGFEHHLVGGDVFSSWTWIRPDYQHWCLLAQIPSTVVSDVPTSLKGQQWRFSFSRYDYTRGQKKPVLSSTSPHPVFDFHRQEDWGKLAFA